MHHASEVDLLLNPLSRWVTKSLFTAATQNNQPWLGTSDPFAKELKNQQRIITDDEVFVLYEWRISEMKEIWWSSSFAELV